jgi:hypothetical protein
MTDDPKPEPEAETSETATEASRPTRKATKWWWAALPAVVMAVVAALPSVAERGAMRQHVWIAAGVCLFGVLVLSQTRPLRVETAIRRPHYMQALTQAGVFVYWAMYWDPVSAFVAPIAVQLAFAYQADALVSWWRGEPWRLGFGPLPIIGSINLFMWFRDDHFGWQLVMIALCYLAKHVIVWTRDGVRRHVFNPSSFGLAVISFGLLFTGTSDLTFGREIALTQEAAPHFVVALFVLGLIVQLQFRVVLVTASAAVATWLLGVVFLRVTGVYMFATTDIPAAVFLGMLLLVTDPATSPRGRAAKVLFGAAYGALAFASFPFLEDLGSLGYYDKLLPVPFLNLFVRRFEGWGAALGNRFGSRPPDEPTSSGRNFVHVAGWGLVFLILVGTNAVGPDHPGRDITFWQRACADQRFRACSTYFNLLTHECEAGRGEACHNLGAELLERQQQGRGVEGRDPRAYFERACELGVQLSCEGLAAATQGGAAGQRPPKPPADPRAAMATACDEGEAEACHALAHLHTQSGAPEDQAKARALYRRGCDLGEVRSCSSFAALEMQKGEGADADAAKAAFEKACAQGDAAGCANLGGMYYLGQGVTQDLARAAELNEKACGLKLAVSCARAAQAYAKGEGVEVDLERAKQLAERACSLGFAPACAPPAPASP